MVKKIKKLKKLNIWFDDPKDAYHFINKIMIKFSGKKIHKLQYLKILKRADTN